MGLKDGPGLGQDAFKDWVREIAKAARAAQDILADLGDDVTSIAISLSNLNSSFAPRYVLPSPAKIALMVKVIILKWVYPIGSVYINAGVSTNPATLLGFGTWSAYAEGKVLVGFNAAETEFDTDEETGGAKTVAASAHNHPLSDNGQTTVALGTNDIFTRNIATAAYNWTKRTNIGVAGVAGPAAISAGQGLQGTTDNATPAASSVLQPYITVRMWKRTA